MYASMTKPIDAGQQLFNEALMGIAAPLRGLINTDNDRAGIAKTGVLKTITDMIANRTGDWSIAPQDKETMARQMIVWNFLLDYYFRAETDGWQRLPDTAAMLVGIHSGTWLTMDAWSFCAAWYRRFNGERVLHGTAHDVLMALPGLGAYFRKVGVIPAKRESVSAAFSAGHDVVIWPGGEVDAMRSWKKRDKVVLGGRKGFIRQAIRSGVPIVPVATVGGHDTVFVLAEGRKLAKMLGLKKILRCDMAPLILGFPFGVTLEAFPMHIPLPAKIRTEILEPVEIDADPDRADDKDYLDRKYKEIESRIQDGVNRLAKKRKGWIFR